MNVFSDLSPDQLLVAREIAADLDAETGYLARTLRQPALRVSGVTGILNEATPSTVWVYGEVDVEVLLAQIVDWQPRPEVMLPEGSDALAVALSSGGWDTRQTVDRVRRDLVGEPVDSPRAMAGLPPDVTVHTAGADDLTVLRDMYVASFGSDHAADYLPDSLLDVPDLQLFVAASSSHARLVGMCGVRARHEGALLFGLATAEACRGQGIGTSLIVECLAWGTRRGAPYVLADVDAPASPLWQRVGFRPTSRWWRCTRG